MQDKNKELGVREERSVQALLDHLEAAWGIIANSGGGDWSTERPEWQDAARKWRDQYHALLERAQKAPGK